MNESEIMNIRAPMTGKYPKTAPVVCQRSTVVLNVAAIMMKYNVPALRMKGGISGPDDLRYRISITTYNIPTIIETDASTMGIVVRPVTLDCQRKFVV